MLWTSQAALRYFIHICFSSIRSTTSGSVCWCRSAGRSVLYNLGVLCACVLAASAMAQPPTRLLLIEMDWGKAPLSCPSLLTHTSVVNTHATLVWLSPFLLFILFSNTLIRSLHLPLLSFCLRDIMHFSDQPRSFELRWSDSIAADPVQKKPKSFYLIYSPSGLRVEPYTNQNPQTVACRQPESKRTKHLENQESANSDRQPACCRD